VGGKYLSLQLRAAGDVDGQIARCVALGANMISVPILGLLVRSGTAFVADLKARPR